MTLTPVASVVGWSDWELRWPSEPTRAARALARALTAMAFTLATAGEGTT